MAVSAFPQKRTSSGSFLSSEDFPVRPEIFPATRLKIPCSPAQGIGLQAIDFARSQGAIIAGEGGILQNSLFISLLAGNLRRRLVRSGLPPQPASAVSPGRFRFLEKLAAFPVVSVQSATLRTISHAVPSL